MIVPGGGFLLSSRVLGMVLDEIDTCIRVGNILIIPLSTLVIRCLWPFLFI